MNAKRLNDPRWRARRRGSRYCAPACGRGCTVAEHRRATELAEAIAAKLGGDWKSHVVENMGWFGWAVHPAGLQVTRTPSGYAALASAPNCGVGSYPGRTPGAALRRLRVALIERREALESLLRAACE